MIACSGLQKMLFAAPVLAALLAVGAGALPSHAVDAVATDVVTVTTVEAAADVATESATDVSSDPADLMVSNCTYYNNASHSIIVGQFGYDCCNNPVAWGKKSKYSVCGGCFPCFPPPQ